MPIYDTTVILSPQLEEKGIDGRIKEIAGRIVENGGKIIRENRMGMRRLAYEIQKISQGYYVIFIYEGNGDLVKELERKFRLDESCLRFLTCLYQEVAPPKERFVREKPGAVATTDKPAVKSTEKPTETTPKVASEVALKTTEATAVPVTDEAPAEVPAPTPVATTPAPAPAATPEAEAPATPAEKDDSATEMEEL